MDLERLKEIYQSPKSTLVGLLAGAAGVLLYLTQATDQGFSSLDPAELAATGSLLVGMIVGMLKKDKK